MTTTPVGTKVLQVAVDWLTATTPADGREWPLLMSGDAILDEEEHHGAELERARWQGYDLKTCGGCWVGAREDSAIVRLSGETAGMYWERVIRHAKKITRLDLAVTVRPEPPDRQLAAKHLDEVLQWRTGRVQPFKVAYHGSPEGLQTIYLGSRQSPTFGRIYDKHAESEDDRWRDSWRYEVETKDVVATRLARALLAERHRQDAMRVYVHDWYSKHGVKPRFSRPFGDVHAPAGKPPTTEEQTLRWWDDQVAGVYAKLSPKVGAGRMLAALGVGGSGTDAESGSAAAQGATDDDR